ncbi:MAG: hypothetical protein K2K55_03735 [Duncaniella sp.]|nr:hypothetical protein [Duncaniella sp.]
MKEYSETEVVKALREVLPEDLKKTVDDDELLNVVDIIWDWYDDNGLLDLDSEEDLDVDALKSYVRKMIAKDKQSPLSPDLADTLVEAELAYENTLDF